MTNNDIANDDIANDDIANDDIANTLTLQELLSQELVSQELVSQELAPQELVPQERAALVMWHLTRNIGLTTFQVAKLTGITRQGAWAMMMRLARVTPIYCNEQGNWELIQENSEELGEIRGNS